MYAVCKTSWCRIGTLALTLLLIVLGAGAAMADITLISDPTLPVCGWNGLPSVDGNVVFLTASDYSAWPCLEKLWARDLHSGRLTSVTLPDLAGGETKALYFQAASPDGRYAALEVRASTIYVPCAAVTEGMYLLDRVTQTSQRLDVDSGKPWDWTNSYGYVSGISRNGHEVLFKRSLSGALSSYVGLYVEDLVKETVEQVDILPDGQTGGTNLASQYLSEDGRYVLFGTGEMMPDYTVVTRLYVRDRLKQTTEVVSLNVDGQPANGVASCLSPDVRYVLYKSDDTTLLAGLDNRTHAVLRDRVKGTTEVVGLTSDGTPVESDPFYMTHDGRYIVFTSMDPLLVPDPSNNPSNYYFVRDRLTDTTWPLIISCDGNVQPYSFSLANDGRIGVFDSQDPDLSPTPCYGTVFLWTPEHPLGLAPGKSGH